MEKTIGELIDELSIINIKIFMMVEQVEKHENTIEDAWKMNDLIKQRSKLKSAINEYFGERKEIKVYESDKKK
jgi:hypothetical protein